MFFKPENIKPLNMTLEENNYNDAVFNSNRSPRHGVKPTILDDRDYNKPDKAVYYFSTMGNECCAMHSDNMVTPIRSKPTLNGFHMYNELVKNMDTKEDIKNGIYIVTYYTFFNFERNNNLNNILNYYNYTNDIKYDEKILQTIKNKLLTSPKLPVETKVRIVSFIPEDVIRSKNFVYIPEHDVVIILGDPSKTRHPNTYNFDKSNSNTIKTNNTITVEIIDNLSSEPYYIKVGKNAIRVYPKQDLNSINKARVKIERDGITISDTECELNKAYDVFGITKDEQTAKDEGDINVRLQLQRAELEKEKILMDYNKIKHEYEKIELERDLLINKFKHEERMMNAKETVTRLDINKKQLDMEFAITKHELDVQTTMMKAVTDVVNSRTKLQNDLRLAEKKYQMDKKKADLDAGSKILTAAVSLSKLALF